MYHPEYKHLKRKLQLMERLIKLGLLLIQKMVIEL